MRQILRTVNRYNLKMFTPVFALVMGVASCAICGGNLDTNGKDVCTPFEMISTVGLPNGPVTVSWTPGEAPYISGYRIFIETGHGQLAYGATDSSQTTITLTVDQTIANQVMADPNPTFTVLGSGSLSNARGFGDCEWNHVITFERAAKKNVIHPNFTPT